MTPDIPTYPKPKSAAISAVNETVSKSIAKPDAFSKSGTISNTKTRVRTTSVKPGNRRGRKRDPRNIQWY